MKSIATKDVIHYDRNMPFSCKAVSKYTKKTNLI